MRPLSLEQEIKVTLFKFEIIIKMLYLGRFLIMLKKEQLMIKEDQISYRKICYVKTAMNFISTKILHQFLINTLFSVES